MRSTETRLPYWDGFLKLLREQYPAYNQEAFHSHYGCWDDPSWSNRRPADYGRAAERMCQKVCDAARIKSSVRVLDIGCGLGSVISSLNQRFSAVALTGLNVDLRQLDVARRGVVARDGNTVNFVGGDAVALPFAEGSFDVVLALECSMHFASRERFLREVARVLRPSGRLALCEHFARPGSHELPDSPKQSEIFGPFLEPISVSQFSQMADRAGLRLVHDEDVSRQTVPTFPMVRRMLWRSMTTLRLKLGSWLTLTLAEALIRFGLLHYRILVFEAAAEPRAATSKP
jgi:ubiquinone/menaquinone biosynthesis C-methylase UbiE